MFSREDWEEVGVSLDSSLAGFLKSPPSYEGELLKLLPLDLLPTSMNLGVVANELYDAVFSDRHSSGNTPV